MVRDLESPSGWRFRSDYATALDAYRRAFALAPSFAFTFGQDPVTALGRLFFTEAGSLRRGFSEVDSMEFRAYPALAGDSLFFTPWPTEDIASGNVDTGTLQAALDHDRQILWQVVDNFVDAFPDNVTALLAKAGSLELQRRLESILPEFSAVYWSGRAMNAATSAEDSLRAAVVHVRLLIKTEDFDGARDAAAAVLADYEDEPPPLTQDAAALAALIGWPHEAARLAAAAAVSRLDERGYGDVPSEILAESGRLSAYAAVGAPADSIRTIASRLEAMMSAPRLDLSASISCALLANPIATAFPVLRRPVEPACWSGADRYEMQYWIDRSEPERVFDVMDRISAARADVPPAEVTIDVVYPEAWLLAEAGDTARATGYLDEWLHALPATRHHLTRQMAQAGGLVNAFVLRADIAAATGDRATAARWAHAAASLWRNADASELLQTVARMNGHIRRAEK